MPSPKPRTIPFYLFAILSIVISLTNAESQGSGNATCRPYKGHVCYNVIGDSRVFATESDGDSLMAEVLASLDNVDVASGCRDFIKSMLCHLAFPFCYPNDREATSGRPVCVADCLTARNQLCLHDWALVSNLSHVVVVGRKAGVDLWSCSGFGDQPECWSQLWKPQAEYKKGQDPDSCYVGIGRGYTGVASATRSGYSCQNWKSQTPHAHPYLNAEANYCRNPDGGRATQPWCYTTNASVPWEECNVPKCNPELKCERSTEWVCQSDEYSHGTYFVNTSEVTSVVEMSKRLVAFYQMFKRSPNDEDCLEALSHMICFLFMPQCDSSTLEPRQLPLCQEYCEHVQNGACHGYWNQIATAIKNNPQLKLVSLPQCSQLPSQYGEKAPECVPKPEEPPSHFHNDCYTGHGMDYSGKISVTKSGVSCQQWSSQYPHAHLTKVNLEGNTCRNPSGQRTQPWCYTTDVNIRWEYCDLPKCETTTVPVPVPGPEDASKTIHGDSIQYILAGVVGGVLILVFAGLVIVLWIWQKRQGKAQCCWHVADEQLLTENDFLGEILGQDTHRQIEMQRTGNGRV
eukprot:m.8077 g.8077  ORF g.8077 m.8077 type:complete len:572 (+) comp20310_c0_seq2:258-1973(+)